MIPYRIIELKVYTFLGLRTQQLSFAVFCALVLLFACFLACFACLFTLLACFLACLFFCLLSAVWLLFVSRLFGCVHRIEFGAVGFVEGLIVGCAWFWL